MKTKKKFMFTSLLGLLIICNFLAFSLIDGAPITYPVDHYGYKDVERKVVTWGGDEEEGSIYAATDANGYLYVTCFSKSFGITGEDVWVIKYDTNMTVLWNVTWETNDDARPFGIVVDSNGYLYVGGTIATEVGVGNYTSDAFLTKFSHNGTRFWNYTRHDPNQEDEVSSVSIDNDDNIYLTGRTNSTQGEVFIQKYSSEGTYQSTFYYGVTAPREDITPGGTAIDNEGNFFLAATTDNCPSGHIKDLVLVKINATGHHVWNRTAGVSSSIDRGTDVAISGNNIYVVGSLSLDDAIVVKFNSTSGQQIWNSTYDLPSSRGNAISINKHGYPVILGYTEDYAVTGDLIMAEFLDNGTVLWDDSYQGAQVDIPTDIVAHGDWMYALGQTFESLNQHQIVIIVYEDYTVTQQPTIGPYGKIFGSIIGGLIAVFAILFIVGILLTYWKKS